VNNLKRHYGILNINKPRHFTYREQAARILIASIARACGRRDCGVKNVLFAFPYAHFVLAAVEIDYKSKNRSVDNLRMSKTGEGPFYMGRLFDREFLLKMWDKTEKFTDKREAVVDFTTSVPTAVDTRKFLNKLLIEFDGSEHAPDSSPFFYSIPDVARKLSCSAVPAREKIVKFLREKYGFSSCGTVFDTTGGIRVGGMCIQDEKSLDFNRDRNFVEIDDDAVELALTDALMGCE